MVSQNGYLLFRLVSIYLVWLSASANSYQCAYRCTCTESTIKCSEKQLKTVPDFKRVDIQPDTIDLADNKIEEILEHSFASSKLQKVKYLQINDNEIFNIHQSAFSFLTDLQYLDLSNNQLDYIPSDIIQKNTKLLELNLSNNLFGLNTPTIISESVLVLDLSSCKLETFTEDNLQATPKLQALYMHINNFHHLEYHVFRKSSLKFLDISYNPWRCHCDTVKLFEHLIKYGIVKLHRNVQCVHSNKLFEDIYAPNGPLSNNFCKKKPHLSNHITETQKTPIKDENEPSLNKEDSKSPESHQENVVNLVMHFEVIVITGIASVIIVVSLITLAVVVRRTHPVQHTVYKEVSTEATYL